MAKSKSKRERNKRRRLRNKAKREASLEDESQQTTSGSQNAEVPILDHRRVQASDLRLDSTG